MNINIIDFHISSLKSMKKYPKQIYYKGNLELLNKKKVSIVGSRKPNQYAHMKTHQIASKLSQRNICIVSGGAMGIDTIAHKAAGLNNTIMVSGTGLDKRYPAINRKMIECIEDEGLIISQFKEGVPSYRYNFPIRNELIVGLSDILFVAYADSNSGTMRSIEYALNMNKKIYVLPHRLGESNATNELLEKKLVTAIYNIDEFVDDISDKKIIKKNEKDHFLLYCETNPSYDEAVKNYNSKVFEYELLGKIQIRNGIIFT